MPEGHKFSQFDPSIAKLNSANFTTNGEFAKNNSAKFASFGAVMVNRENKFRENLCPRKFVPKVINTE